LKVTDATEVLSLAVAVMATLAPVTISPVMGEEMEMLGGVVSGRAVVRKVWSEDVMALLEASTDETRK